MAFARCSKSMNYLEAQHFCDFASNMIHEYDYIFYVSPEGVDIEDNGVRETDAKYRKTIDETIKYFINKHNSRIKNFVRLKGSTEERIKIIQEITFSTICIRNV